VAALATHGGPSSAVDMRSHFTLIETAAADSADSGRAALLAGAAGVSRSWILRDWPFRERNADALRGVIDDGQQTGRAGASAVAVRSLTIRTGSTRDASDR